MTGGTAAFVAEAVTADGAPAVLKLAMPSTHDGRDALALEAAVLLAADGRGCARAFAHHHERGALLLERLGGQLAASALPVEDQLRAIATALTELWTVPC